MVMPTTCQWLCQQLCLSYAPRGYARGYVHGYAHKTMPITIPRATPTTMSMAMLMTTPMTGLNFSPRNSTQCGSLVPTRLSLASPFRSCFPTTMCFAHPKRFSQLPRRKQRMNTSKHTELYKNNSQPLFISSTKDYTIKSVCAMHINRMLHNRGLAAYL